MECDHGRPPIGPTHTFALEAFDADGAQIYGGSSTRVLASGESISVGLIPYDNRVSVRFPIVRSISRPAHIQISSTVGVTQGSTDEALNVQLGQRPPR